MEQEIMKELFGSSTPTDGSRQRKTANLFASSLNFKESPTPVRKVSAQMDLLKFVSDFTNEEAAKEVPLPKSDDIRKFVGNVYLEKEQFDKIEDEKPLEILKQGELLAALREQDFQIENYYRLYEKKIGCMRRVLFHYSLAIASLCQNISVTLYSIVPKIKEWTRRAAAVLEIQGDANPRATAFRAFKIQIAADFKDLAEYIEKLRKESRRIADGFNPKDPENFYSVVSEALAVSFSQYTSAMTNCIQLATNPSKGDIQLNALASLIKFNMCTAEFTLVSIMKRIDIAIRAEHSELSSLLEATVTRLKFAAVEAGQTVTDLKELIKEQPSLPTADIIKGFQDVFDLEQLSHNSYLDLGRFPAEVVEFMRTKTGPVNNEALVDQFFEDYANKYTKHSLLIRHCMECSTVGTNKRCLLLLDIFNNLILVYLPESELKLKWPVDVASLVADARSNIGFVAHLSLVAIEGTKAAKSFQVRVAEGASAEGACAVTLSYVQSPALMRLMKHCASVKARKSSH